MGNFANKVTSAFLAGTALLFVCPHHAFGQTWTTTDTPATVNVANGNATNLTSSTVSDGNNLALGDAGHTLAITDNNAANTGGVTSLGTITTVSGGGGMLVFNLRNANTELTVGQIGTANRRIALINVQNSNPGNPPNGGGRLIVDGNVFAETLTVGRTLTFTADAINVITLTNSGMLTANDAISAETLTNNDLGELIATDIDAETLTNSGTLTTAGAINAGTLTNSGTLSADSITAVTLTNSGSLESNTVIAETLTNSGTLTIGNIINNGTLTVGTLTNNGNLIIYGEGTVGTLGGSGNIMRSDDLTIGNTGSGGFGGSITATTLTVRQGLFRNAITTFGDFTANLNGNLTIVGTLAVDGNANFAGSGRADLGTVTVTGNTAINNNATVALDIVKSEFGSSGITATGNGTLEVYGESADAPAHFPVAFTGGHFKNIAIFTDWKRVNNQIVHGGIRDQAYMNDGYLAAFTIHHRYTAWNMVRDRLISGNDHDDYGKTAWFNYIGRSNAYHSSFNNRDWKTFTHGGQIGVDVLKTPRFQSGLLFGYEGSQSKNDRDQLKANDFYFGVYGACLFRGGVDARIVFAQGWQGYDLDRMGNGGVLYTSSFNGWTSEANVELGKRMGSGGWSLRPVLAADVFNNNLRGTREAGRGGEGVVYGKTSLTQVFLRTGTDFRYQTKAYTFNSGMYYAHDVNGAELRTRVTSVNDDRLTAPLIGTKLGNSLLMFNLGVEGEVTSNLFLFGGYTGEYVMGSSKDTLHSICTVGFFGKW